MKKILFSIMMLAMAGQMMAVPAYRGWQTKTQPDGTTVTVRQGGDEYYHYWENENGEQVEENEQGFWQAVGEAPTPAAVASRRAESRMYRTRKAVMAEGIGSHKAAGYKNLAPRGLIILVNFKDQKYESTNTPTAMNEMMNGDNYTYNGAMGSARKYFSDQSNGKYVPTFDVVGPVTVKKNYAYYGQNVDGVRGEDAYVIDMLVEACQEADKLGVDFTKYDNDGDGYVDFVYVIYAGMGEADGGTVNTIWPHNWNAYSAAYYSEYYGYNYTTYKTADLVFDGKKIDNYACSGEINGQTKKRNGIGVICHEFGHVLGLPDYYDTEYGTNYDKDYTPGDWDVMDGGSYNGHQNCPPNYSPWEKYYFGWATPTCLSEKGNYTLSTDYGQCYQVNNSGSLANWDNTNLQFYIENRQQSGWDTYLPGHGMLVWEVLYDKDAWEKNAPNNEANNPRYVVMSASGSMSMQGAADPFPGKNNVTSFNTFKQYPVKNIKENNGQITFTFIEDTPVPERWSAWTDFAPRGYATGSYTYNIMLKSGTWTQTQIPVKIRTNLDKPNQHEIKICNWGKDFLSNDGVDIIIEWNEQTNACRVKTQYSGWTSSNGDVYIGDLTAITETDHTTDYPCTYDPESATFTLSVAYYLEDGRYYGFSGDEDGHTTETLKMDFSSVNPMEYDELTDIEVAFTTTEIVTTEAEGTEIFFKAIKANNSHILSLYFYANGTDADIVIPAGEYTFSKSQAQGTVLISEGVVDYSVYPSFLATMDGEYVDKLWFPVEGKVTVEKVTINGKKEIYMKLDAVNSLDAKVKATVGSKPVPTAIQETIVKPNAVKTLENGQLLIHREGKTYNVVGAKLADK